MSDRNSIFAAHHQDSLTSELVVNVWHLYLFVVFKNLAAPLCILSLYLEVELSWQAHFEFRSEPLIPEVGKQASSCITSYLDHLKVSWHLLLNPFVLYFHNDWCAIL